MNKGIYIALSGAVLKKRNLDIFAQNIANTNTSGYKKERLSFKEFIIPVDNNHTMVPDERVMGELSKSMIDFSNGPVKRTGNPLDVAINGEGFFALEGGRYTRNGSFTVNNEGFITTEDGIPVLADGGPVSVEGNDIVISSSGEINVDGVSIGKLQIVDFPDKEVLTKVNGTMFTAEGEGTEVESSQVSQGFLEQSNVNAIQEMVQMLASQREFESYQKMIHAFDEAAGKTINEMGK